MSLYFLLKQTRIEEIAEVARERHPRATLIDSVHFTPRLAGRFGEVAGIVNPALALAFDFACCARGSEVMSKWLPILPIKRF